VTDTRPTIASVADALKAAVPTLDPAEQRLALELYRLLLRGRPVAIADLASSAGLAARDVERALGRWPGVYRDRKGRVIGFWGLAIRGMPHRMATAKGEITTWCALDPLIIAPLITDEAGVESADPVSGQAIRLTVTRSGVRDVSPSGVLVSMVAPDGPFGRDVVERFCHFVHFFASDATARQWVTEHPGTFVLTVDEAYEVATRSWPVLFNDALALRPSGS
jgi:alkylmercury lyase